MQYSGKLYGKINGKFIPLKLSADDVNEIHERMQEQLRAALGGHPESELWGESGLVAATMRCVDAVNQIEEIVTTDHESKDSFIARVREILEQNDANNQNKPKQTNEKIT